MPGWVRQVLRAAALLGVDLVVSDLAIVLGRSVVTWFRRSTRPVRPGVLVESGTGLGFRHPLIRTALYEEIPSSVRAAWHREARARWPKRVRPPTGWPGSCSRRRRPADTEPMDEWILRWLIRTAPLLVGQAPRAAAELLSQAATRSPAGSPRHDSLICRFAEALYRVGDATEAERVASRALADVVEPDLHVDLHWTLAQCRTLAGRFNESLAELEQALAHPEVSGWHRARLLVLTARAHRQLGHVEKAGQVASAALAEATAADDNWAIGWALHVSTMVTVMQGRVADALPLFDQALTVTQADPALTDLRLLLQLNKALTLGGLDQYDGAFTAARQAQQLAARVGLAVRAAQAHCCLGELLFNVGHWDDAMAEVNALQESAKDPGVACSDHGVAAVISFHRGETAAAQSHLAAAAPDAKRIGNRVVGTLALARSLEYEQAGDLARALAVLTGFADNAEELDQIEGLLADGVRLATRIGDWNVAAALADRAEALAEDTAIMRRRATASYCRGLLDRDAGLLLQAADRYRGARRPLLGAQALEAAAGIFLDRATVRRPGRPSLAHSISTGHSARPVTWPGCRPGSARTESAARRG